MSIARLLRPALAALLLLGSAACRPTLPAGRGAEPAAVAGGRGHLVADSVGSAAIAGNRLGDPATRRVTVYLPPGYHRSPRRRFPVLYLLHGFQGTDAAWLRGPQYQELNVRDAMDSLLAAGAVREMIVVMPDARNRIGGSFYTDSPVTGGWETFVAHELVQAVDARYRTIARPESRGIAGHSMGGYGALRLGMRHGGSVFGAVYALSPCCTRFGDRPTGAWTAAWDSLLVLPSFDAAPSLGFAARVNLALALALSPDSGRSPVPAELPYARGASGLAPVPAVLERWRAGAPLGMIAGSREALRRLRGLRLDVGRADALVPVGDLEALDSALAAHGVPHRVDVYDGTHGSRIRERMVTEVLPFFSATLHQERQ